MNGLRADRLDAEAQVFAVLRTLTLVGGVAALLIVPLRPEHQLHLAPLLVGFVVYKALLYLVLLLWFTGGGESHFYLLFFLLVALNAHYFGPAVGVLAAALASALLVLANFVGLPAPWAHVGSRGLLLGLLGLALGHVAARERAARAQAEELHREKEAAMARLARAGRPAAGGRPAGEG